MINKILLTLCLLVTLVTSASAQFTFPINHFSAPASGDDFLDSIAGLSVSADLDATIAASYGGSGQTWSNLIASPSDGAAQSDHDFWLGLDGDVSTDDPPFVGSAGADDAYFDLITGGDFFTVKSVSAAITLKKAHRSDTSGTWIAIAFRPTTGVGYIWANTNNPQHGRGVRGVHASNGDLSAHQNSPTLQNIFMNVGATLSFNTPNLVIISWDGTSTSNNAKIWLNSATANDTQSSTFKTDITDATNLFFIGARNLNGPDSPLFNARVYGFYYGDEYLDDTKAAAIRTHLQARHAAGRY